MSLSLRTRIFRLTFFVNILFSGVILAFSWWSLEQLEASVFSSDLSAEIHYFYENGDKTRPQKIVTSQVTAAFIPRNHHGTETLPVLFEALPVPFQGEVELLGKEYFVVTKALPEGNYYLAKDLARYESREYTLTFYTLALGILSVAMCFVVATVFSRKIADPTLLLARQIQNLDDRQEDARLSTHFIDTELNEIAGALNDLLNRIQDSAQRERSLISMASHELRTPVSVILGAARVIEKRNQLDSKDQITLARIIQASEHMSDNIRALLAVVKQAPENLEIEYFDLGHLIRELIQHYQYQPEVDLSRLLFEDPPQPVHVRADQALVRMMLHNLISNALNHTPDTVQIALSPDSITIQDQGTDNVDQQLQMPSEFKPSSGLGLYIVTLICRRLNWQINLEPSGPGHCVTITF